MSGLAPFLMFPNVNRYLTAASAAGIVLLWLARWQARGSITRRTPLDGFILILMLMLPVAMWVSPLPAQSIEALCRVLLGVALYYSIVNGVNDERAWRFTLDVAVVAGLAIALIGLLAADWGQSKIPLLDPIYQLFPSLAGSLGFLASEADSTPGSFHPNLIGAALALLLPIVAARCLTARSRIARIAIGLAALVMAMVLVLTQSRLAMASLALAASVTALRLFPRLLFPFIGLALAAMFAVLAIGPANVFTALTPAFSATGFGSWQSRIGLWEAGLRMLTDFPFTGVGLSTFYPAVTYLYPINVPSAWIFGHAHEIYLQMGLDLGWPGLIGFVGVMVTALVRGWPNRQEASRAIRLHRAAAWTSLLAYALFGLFDGLPMWTKPGFLIWIVWAWISLGIIHRPYEG